MARKSASGKLDNAVENAVKKLLAETMDKPEASLTDKCKALDRALKWAAIKAKMADDTYGSGFKAEDE